MYYMYIDYQKTSAIYILIFISYSFVNYKNTFCTIKNKKNRDIIASVQFA